MQKTYNPEGAHQRMNQMVIIGHSMGGLLTELQVKNSGYSFWPEDPRDFLARPVPRAGTTTDTGGVL